MMDLYGKNAYHLALVLVYRHLLLLPLASPSVSTNMIAWGVRMYTIVTATVSERPRGLENLGTDLEVLVFYPTWTEVRG